MSCPLANHNGYSSGQEGNGRSWHILSIRGNASNSEVPYCPNLVCFSTGKPTSSRTCRMLEHSIPRLEDHVERRFRGATDLSKAACLDYLGKFHLSGLRAQRHAHLLR